MLTALVFAYIITQFPDGTDSIGIPDIEYRGTCFVRCESAPEQTVYCHVAQRLSQCPLCTVDCAGHCRHSRDRQQIPLPNHGGIWRQAQGDWCRFIREKESGRYHWPSCHAENYQMLSLRKFGPADVECDYLTLPPGVDFEYTEELPPEGSAMGAFVQPGEGFEELKRRLNGKGRRVRKGRGPGSYRVRYKATRGAR